MFVYRTKMKITHTINLLRDSKAVMNCFLRLRNGKFGDWSLSDNRQDDFLLIF